MKGATVTAIRSERSQAVTVAEAVATFLELVDLAAGTARKYRHTLSLLVEPHGERPIGTDGSSVAHVVDTCRRLLRSGSTTPASTRPTNRRRVRRPPLHHLRPPRQDQRRRSPTGGVAAQRTGWGVTPN